MDNSPAQDDSYTFTTLAQDDAEDNLSAQDDKERQSDRSTNTRRNTRAAAAR